jgi:hypothetical protein
VPSAKAIASDLAYWVCFRITPSTIDEQLIRVYGNYQRKSNDLERYIFLTALQDRNETLFYRLLQKHITEMMPIIYTPTVGEGCRRYSHVFRRPRVCTVSYPYRDQIAELLDNTPNADRRCNRGDRRRAHPRSR